MFEIINLEVYIRIKKIIMESRNQVAKYINTSMLFVYWNIGKMIFDEQNGYSKAKYGEGVIRELSKQLTLDFGKGFDESNLRKMRKFYSMYQNWDTVSLELSWTHYRILVRINDNRIRNFYMDEAIKGNWSVRQLERQIDTCAYSRVIAHNQKVEIIDVDESPLPYDTNSIIKDPYILEFMGLDGNTNYIERELEDALVNHLQKFLLELGRGFCFVARQKRISYDNEHYFVDLVFYNSILKCYFVIDLKVGKATHEALGQIDLYRNYFDEEIKSDDDNPTIGLLLVTKQDKLVAKYSSIYKDQNIFVSKYMPYMPTEDELKRVINEEKRIIEEYKMSRR